MGIQGLLPLLKSIMLPIHIKDLDGCSVAIDTYSWLHKGALSCSKELCKGQPTSKHINYCMHRVNLLRHHGVKPILVFDGGFLPMKSDQENKRARLRKENLARAIEHESSGNSSAAYEYYQKAVDISPSIAYDLIQVLKHENVSYIVAPYEADAQMTFLAVTKQVDAVITEDSDLIAFGCPRIIYKMDKFGQGVEFRYSMLEQNKELNFAGFTKQMLLEMCIFSGCDYLQSLPGMGLKKAHALVKKFKTYDKVIKHLKYNTIAVPPLYEESFKKAILTFQHQRVYDPIIQDIVHLSDPSENIGEDSDFLGPVIPQHIAKGIACGDIDPLTKVPFKGEGDKSTPVIDETYQLKNFKQVGEKKKLDLPAQKNLLTNYFCFATLEAKRKFRVPRITLKHPNSNSGTPSSVEDINEEENSCKINCSAAALADTENYANVTLTKDHVDNGVSQKAFVFSEASTHEVGQFGEDNLSGDMRKPLNTSLQQSGRSIHPCVESHKGQECNFTSNAGEGKIRIESKKVIVRSSYFQKKSTKDDSAAINESKSVLIEGEMDLEKTNITASSSFLQSMKENNSSIERKRIGAKRKGILRSSYFQHNSSKGDDKENENENVLPNYGSATDTFEDIIPFEDKTMKRKFDDPIDIAQTENLNHKYLLTNEPYPIQSVIGSEEREPEQEKFGCNISHLGQYSEIAEKSIEKFVSVISSFKCSSGSRASGLRAPLKDVNNTCTRNKLNEGLDLNKFSYIPPSKRKVSSLSCRRKNI